MPIMNNRYQWGALTIALHWLVFLLVAGLFASGKISAQGERPDPDLMSVHAPVGAAVVLVMLTRYFWRLVNPSVGRVDDGLNFFVVMLSWLVHNLLYFAVVAQGLTGIAMSQTGGREPELFGWVFPKLIGAGGFLPLEHPILGFLELGQTERAASEALRGLHGLLANVLFGLVALHILGALYHRFIRGDDLLRRMWFGYVPPDLKRKKEKE